MSAVKLESAIINALDIHCNRYGNKVISKELSEEISQLIKSVSKCRALRNKLAHYLWMRSNDEEIFGSRMSGKLPKNNGKSDAVKISVIELEKNHELAHELMKNMQRMVIDKLPKIEEEQNLTISSSGRAKGARC